MNNNQETMTVPALLDALRDESGPLPAAAIYRLSALPSTDLGDLAEGWHSIAAERRRLLLSRLRESSEADFEMDFRGVAHLALDDDDDEVRRLAISCLWEDKSPVLMRRLTEILAEDPSAATREEAAAALGRFVLLGELGKMPTELTSPVEELLLSICHDGEEGLDVRRRALESVAYSGRDDVCDLIEDAFDHDVIRMRASAVFAMGRNADRRWESHVLQELASEDPEIRYEAAHAAGELELDEAVPDLIGLLDSFDVELTLAAIWALGEIGGAEVRHALNGAAERLTDESLLDAIDDALSMAALHEGAFSLLDVDHDEFLNGNS